MGVESVNAKERRSVENILRILSILSKEEVFAYFVYFAVYRTLDFRTASTIRRIGYHTLSNLYVNKLLFSNCPVHFAHLS